MAVGQVKKDDGGIVDGVGWCCWRAGGGGGGGRYLTMEFFVMPTKAPITADAVIGCKCSAVTFQTLALFVEEEAGGGGVGDAHGMMMAGMATSRLGNHKGTGDGLGSRFHSCAK